MLDTREPRVRGLFGAEPRRDVSRQRYPVLTRGACDGEPRLARQSFVHLDEIHPPGRERVDCAASRRRGPDQRHPGVGPERLRSVQRQTDHEEARSVERISPETLPQREGFLQGAAHYARAGDTPTEELRSRMWIVHVDVHVPEPGDKEASRAVQRPSPGRQADPRGAVHPFDASAAYHHGAIEQQGAVLDVHDGDVRDGEGRRYRPAARGEEQEEAHACAHGNLATASAQHPVVPEPVADTAPTGTMRSNGTAATPAGNRWLASCAAACNRRTVSAGRTSGAPLANATGSSVRTSRPVSRS